MPSNAVKRKPHGLDIPRTTALESPPGIAALFAIRFDIRTGYVIAWKRSVSGFEVEGVVEFKSLPSGLHNVAEDLVYFVHEQYAGLSAFINLPGDEAERNAKMFAVGVMVPLSFGRLGKSWRHAPKLKELVQQYAQDTSNNKPLEEFWETYQIRRSNHSEVPPDPPLDSPISVRFGGHDLSHRNRAFSDAMVLEQSRPALTSFHPASSLPRLIDSFGPLIFPLYRAALLRRRILVMTDAPVHLPCNYVYDISLLASVPNSVLPLLPSHSLPPSRPRPLFNVGIHDIPYLSSNQDRTWLACSTDTVLTMKPDLYDVLVTLPAPYTKDAAEKHYPKLSVHATSKPGTPPTQTDLKATQRDARRYNRLRRGLRHLSYDDNSQVVSANPTTTAATTTITTTEPRSPGPETQAAAEEEETSDAASTYSSPIVEPLSWTQLAYTSFIWWASAGEKREGLSEEEEEQQIEQDSRLLARMESLSHPRHSQPQPQPQPQQGDTAEHQQPAEVALVAYFRRLTAQIFVILADVIARHDDDGIAGNNNNNSEYRDHPDENDESNESEDNDEAPLLDPTKPATTQPNPTSHAQTEDPVTITTEDMTEMGLDIWSAADRLFVEEMVRLWWGRAARVDCARIRCCGITIL